MKIRTMAVAAGISAPLILTAAADGGCIGLRLDAKPNEFGIHTVNIYVEFDNMGNDSLTAVGGTPNSPLNITILGGTFWNHASTGGDTAPAQGLINNYPSLAYDSFYTIGLKAIPMGGSDQTTLDGMPTLGPPYGGNLVTSVATTNGSWRTIPPTSPQADPWDPSSGGSAGDVLIGQFSTTNGQGLAGRFMIQFVADGQPGEQWSVSFSWLCIDDDACDDGDPCNGDEYCVHSSGCWSSSPHPDCNHNGVLDSCDIAHGTSLDCNTNGVPDDCDIDDGTSPDINGNGVPDECECVADCSADGVVSVSDFLLLLSQWGNVGSGCDFDGGGVGVTDFLYLLAHWGPCP